MCSRSLFDCDNCDTADFRTTTVRNEYLTCDQVDPPEGDFQVLVTATFNGLVSPITE
jgi:hypothetical protein